VAGFEQLGAGSGGDGAAASAVASASGVGAGGGGAPEKGPPYPVVLAHGFMGADEFAGAAFADYFYQVKGALALEGELEIHTPAVDPFNSSAARGGELAAFVEALRIETGYAKVNLVGHSQGGLDARVVAHDHPSWVASVVTLQTPHRGTPLADVALKLIEDPGLADVLDALVKVAGRPVYDAIGEETSLAKPLHDFSEKGIAVFNATYTDQPGVYYASITGRSDMHPGGVSCAAAGAPPFIEGYAGALDPIDPIFVVTEAILDGELGAGEPNDGLVRASDAQWGEFLGCVPADHLDLIGHLFGDAPGAGNPFDHRAFYADLVAWLRQRGL
jgi:triacylglycerol lipase